MSNIRYQPIGKLLLIKARVKEKSAGGIILPYEADDMDFSLNRQKEILITEETVVAVGDKVEHVKAGDKVHTFKRELRFINSDKCRELGLEKEKGETYYIADEDKNILAIIK
jgi:co-chaperonin GroES (HSP10)